MRNNYKEYSSGSIGFYENRIKRPLDFCIALLALLILSPVLIITALLVRFKLGSPVIFIQKRPGLINPINGKENIFKLYKFRTMTDEKDDSGKLLSDELRLTKFGAWLRSTSLDELPELLNIIKGDMAIIGPRPQLVRDMVFMSTEQRKRHLVRPGLSGLAQISGRNAISWNGKLDKDLKYINNITFINDFRIVMTTVKKVLIREGINEEGQATALDFGDQLLKDGMISKKIYEEKQIEATNILAGKIEKREDGLVSIIMPSYNTADYIMETIQSVLNQTYKKWELLIVDDCSTDDTRKILEKIEDPRIKVLFNEKNSGAALSRNKALSLAKGQWIAHLDSDDLWEKNKLEKQIDFMESNNYSFSYTNYEEIDMFGRQIGKLVTGPKHITKMGMFNYCWPGCLTVMYDAEKIGLIQIPDIKKNNDYAMWLRVIKLADCYLLDECLAYYRRGRLGSISTQSIKTMVGWHYKLFREVENDTKLQSVINTLRNMCFGLYKKVRYVKRKK